MAKKFVLPLICLALVCAVFTQIYAATTIPHAQSVQEIRKVLMGEPLAKDFRQLRFSTKRRNPVKPSRFVTKVWAWIEKDAVAFQFKVSTGKKPVRKSIMKKHDGPVWNDPCVSVLLDTNRDGSSYYHVMANSAGVVYDSYCYLPFMVDTTWESKANVITSPATNDWTTTIRVPFSSLGATPGPGDQWGLNFLSYVFLETDKEQYISGKQTYILENITADMKKQKMYEDEGYESWSDSFGYDMWFSPKIRPTGDAHELSGLSPLGQANFYHFQRRMMRADLFPAFSLGDNTADGVILEPRTRGGLISTGSKKGETLSVGGSPHANRFQTIIRNTSNKSCTVTAKVFGPGKKSVGAATSVAPGAMGLVDVPYTVEGAKSLKFEISVDGKNRYESDYNLLPKYKSVIVPHTDGTFDESLVYYDKNASGIGSAYWPHHFDYGIKTHSGVIRRNLLLATGIPHVLEDLIDDTKNSRTALVVTAGRERIQSRNHYNELDEWADKLRQKGIKTMLTPWCMTRHDKKTGKVYGLDRKEITEQLFQNKPFLLGEQYTKNFMASLEYGFKNYGDLMWGLYSSDELNTRAIHMLELIWESRKTGILKDDVERIVREITDKYGAGKFGPPLSVEDKNPFRRLAFQRWYTHKSNEFGRKASALAKKYKPDVVVWGNDAHGFPFAPAWYKGAFDMVPDQVTYFPSMPGNVDADVKYLRDITGLDVWPCAHIEGGAPLADAYELYSAVFRVGASGILMYNVSGLQFTVHDIWMAPNRWKLETDISRMFASGLRAKTPTNPDVGIFVSTYSMMAASLICEPRRAEYVSCYRLTGPKCGAWMKFFTEQNLERGEVDLKKFKVIFVPHAPITTQKAAEQLLKAARNGATLVVADPEAFSYGLDATRLGKILNDLYEGTQRTGEKKYRSGSFTFAWPAHRDRHDVPVIRFKENLKWPRAKTFALSDDLTNILTSPTGECVGYIRDYGKGKLIVSGLKIFNGNTDPAKTGGGALVPSEDDGFVAFFRELFEREGVKLDRKIWKLKLPRPSYEPPRHEGFCLTNNSNKWEDNHPRDYLNVPLEGKYKLSPAPDNVKDVESADGWIPFAKGKLTNARRLLKTPIAAMRIKDWVVTWKNTETVKVEIDLGQVCEVREIEGLFSDTIPEVTFSSSTDGKSFKPFGAKAPSPGETFDTRMQTAKGRRAARYVRLEAKGIQKGKKITLAEIRVWGYASADERK